MARNSQLLGSDAMARQLARIGQAAVPAVAAALHEEARLIFAASQRLVPFAEGTLSASGTVFPPSMTTDGVIVEIGYGGNAAAYAEIQHENTTFRHDPGRQAKYLEEPLNDSIGSIEQAVQARVDQILRSA